MTVKIKVFWLCECGKEFPDITIPEEHSKGCLPFQVNKVNGGKVLIKSVLVPEYPVKFTTVDFKLDVE